MKALYACRLIVCLIAASISFSMHGATLLELQPFKTSYGGLSQSFLTFLKQSFHKNILFETGTSSGDTTQKAILVFDEVYSTEISEKLYREAIQKIGPAINLYLYLGDSPKILNQILPTIHQDMVFWLDAHYCGVGTGRGSSDSPVLQELDAIKQCDKKEHVIMIDDLRGFYSENWPSLPEVLRHVVDINPQYSIIAFGDSLLAFVPSEDIVVSDCLKALSVSRFFDTRCFNYTVAEVLEAEEMIAKIKGQELGALYAYFSYVNGSDDQYPLLWQALIHEHNGNSDQACMLLQNIAEKIQSRGINHWRIHWYLARNAFASNSFAIAKHALIKVIDACPDFEPDQKLLALIQ